MFFLYTGLAPGLYRLCLQRAKYSNPRLFSKMCQHQWKYSSYLVNFSFICAYFKFNLTCLLSLGTLKSPPEFSEIKECLTEWYESDSAVGQQGSVA